MSSHRFSDRHIGPKLSDIKGMLSTLKLSSLNELTEKAAPSTILLKSDLNLAEPLSEQELIAKAKSYAQQNKVNRSFIGLGYYNTYTPSVIQRNILENPGWYTAYTPYQAEISQGRMEALLNFQTMVTEITKMEMANASLLDEGTAAAEAMAMCLTIQARVNKSKKLFVDENVLPQTLEVLQTRAEPIGIEIITGNPLEFDFSEPLFAALVQYPGANGEVRNFQGFTQKAHENNTLVIAACDLLSLCKLTPPGEWGTDVVIGSTQRFGVPMGFGGPHAAFLATKEKYKRNIPGRIIGISKDSRGKPSLRLALQTREQHIRRERATSNICTAQVLLGVMASMYAVYHGPTGLEEIANRVHQLTIKLAAALNSLGYQIESKQFFDTLSIITNNKKDLRQRAENKALNLCYNFDNKILISLDETSTENDVNNLIEVFNTEATDLKQTPTLEFDLNPMFVRKSPPLENPIFSKFKSETEILRYITKLEKKDISLTSSMIPLGSCTMKLNATTEMLPITWPEFSNLHPFCPIEQAQGSIRLIKELENILCEITGYAGMSLQPNAGSQGEYAGLLVIRKYLQSINQGHRNICLIPSSAHGTNPASAVMAGMKVVVVKCDLEGNIDMNDLRAKAEAHKQDLAALMVTYPSTHGVFEETIKEICKTIHDNGGQVYTDGANLNALVGISKMQELGSDVSHLNLHKTFCIPHGGGGPGVGPIGVAEHLVQFLPSHCIVPECGPAKGIGAVSSAPWGSASILPISWAYCLMMGADGLKKATEVAILNANYIAHRLKNHYPVLYTSKNGYVAHECIIDTRPFKISAGIDVNDIAKRLMDYGFHAPTMSWPVAGTLMIEPTESESKEELDRFCEAMISIREEIREVEQEVYDKKDNVLTNSPHTADDLVADDWNRAYSREKAFYPLPWVQLNKFFVPVNRVDNAFGDKNLVCTCPSVQEYDDSNQGDSYYRSFDKKNKTIEVTV